MNRVSGLGGRRNSNASYALAIAIALVLFQGLESLVWAASIPLQSVLARLINAVVVRAWRVVPLNEYHDSLSSVALPLFSGLVLLAVGLSVGRTIVPREESDGRRDAPAAKDAPPSYYTITGEVVNPTEQDEPKKQ